MCDEKDVNQMIRKMMLTAIALGAGVTAYLLLKNRDSAKKDEDDSDTEVNFIKISDDEGDDEDEDDKAEPAKQPETEPEVKPEAEPEPEKEPEQPAEEEEKPVDIPVMGGEDAAEPEKQPEVKAEPEKEPEPEQPQEQEAEEPVPDSAEGKSPEIQEICRMYPYLKADFVESIYLKNDELNEKYPEDTLIRIAHKAKFPDQETMEEFGVILEKNGYLGRELGDNTIEVSKKMFTEDVRIISDIYNVANQAACLKGEYLGYEVE
jgi:outer membrane biosynthesis protein TonB